MRHVIVAFFSLVVLIGCNKKESRDLPKEAVGFSPKSGFVSSNPFDNVGVLHNQYLTDFYNQQFTPKPTPKGGELFFREIGFNGFEGVFPATAIIIDKTLTVEDFISNHSKMSTQVKNYLLEMCSKSGNLSTLEKLENTVLADNSLSKTDVETVLVGIAVARHSLEYWRANVDDWVSGADPIIYGRNYAKVDAGAALSIVMSCNLGFVTPPSGMSVLTFAAASGATASAAAALADGIFWVGDQIGENTGWW